jgi:hypothetical protein
LGGLVDVAPTTWVLPRVTTPATVTASKRRRRATI